MVKNEQNCDHVVIECQLIGGPFKNYMDHFLSYFDHLSTYLPIVDFRGHLVHYLPLVHVDNELTTYPPNVYNC